MIAKALSRANATRWLEQRLTGKTPTDGAHEVGAFPRADFDGIATDLRSGLERARGELHDVPSSVRGAIFDSRAAILVHSHLRDIGLNIATDRDFWRYLACGPLFEIIRWRYDGSTTHANYGLGSKWEALPERLWFRAHVSVDPESDDPYTLTRRGGVDFWVSGPIRHVFGGHPALVRALVNYQFPEDGEFVDAGSYSPQTLSNDQIRVIIKELRHFNAVLVLESASEAQLDELIREIAIRNGF